MKTFVLIRIGAALLVVLVLFSVLSEKNVRVDAAADSPLFGYAWSDNIGWISFNCADTNSCATSNYAVAYDTSSGQLSGYAWSDNIGWISFNSSDVTGCPSPPCTPDFDGSGNASGWAKALSAGGGWDGWISLSGSGYGVTRSNGTYSGYAWGSDVVGWIDFTTNEQCTPQYSCQGNRIMYTDGTCNESEVTTCSPPSFCSGGSSVCLYPQPDGELEVTSNLVRLEQTVGLSWNVSNVTECTVNGTNGDSWTGANRNVTSSPIVSSTKYTLTCTAVDGAIYTDSVQVDVTPRFQEV